MYECLIGLVRLGCGLWSNCPEDKIQRRCPHEKKKTVTCIENVTSFETNAV